MDRSWFNACHVTDTGNCIIENMHVHIYPCFTTLEKFMMGPGPEKPVISGQLLF